MPQLMLTLRLCVFGGNYTTFLEEKQKRLDLDRAKEAHANDPEGI